MSDALRKTREAYDGLAETYDRANRSIEDIEGILEAFTRNLKGRLVLDVGCGHGRDAEYFTEQGLDVVGLDLSSELIRIARRKAREACLILADMRRPPFRDRCFDGAWVCASFHHLVKDDAPEAVKEFTRVLGDNAVAHFSVKRGSFTGFETRNRYRGGPRYYSFYTGEELMKLITEAGLKVKHSNITAEEKLDGHWINLLLEREPLQY